MMRVRRLGLVGILVLVAMVVSGSTALAAPGDINTIAGTGPAGYNGDGILATSAKVDTPWGVAVDAAGNVFIGDTGNHRVRRVDATTGLISTIAGTGVAGFNADGILAINAQLNRPYGVAVDAVGNVVIADHDNHRVRRFDATTGLISTVAGTGTAGYNFDNIAANTAWLNGPSSVAVDAVGNVFIADRDNHRVRRFDAATLKISTIAGTGVAGFNGDGIAANSANLKFPLGVAVDAAGNVFIADTQNARVRRVDATTALIWTIAGSSGIGGLATSAPVIAAGVAVDAAGNVFMGTENSRVHRVGAAVCMGQPATLIGTSGADVLTGTAGPDVIMGLGGADTINGLGGADRICSGGGADVVHGNGGKDRIKGGGGDDTIYGDANNDRLYGGVGVNDLIGGGNGNDHCTQGNTYNGCDVIF